MLEEIRRKLEGPEALHWKDGPTDSRIRATKLELAVDLMCHLMVIGSARYGQDRTGDTRKFEEMVGDITKKVSHFKLILKASALQLAKGEPPKPGDLPQPILDCIMDQEQNTAGFNAMLQYALTDAAEDEERNHVELLWALCLYYALTLNGAPCHLDAVADLALARVSQDATAIMVGWWHEGDTFTRTKRSTANRRKPMQDRERKVLEAYDSIKRDGKSLSRMAKLIEDRLNGEINKRTIYRYLVNAGKV